MSAYSGLPRFSTTHGTTTGQMTTEHDCLRRGSVHDDTGRREARDGHCEYSLEREILLPHPNTQWPRFAGFFSESPVRSGSWGDDIDGTLIKLRLGVPER